MFYAPSDFLEKQLICVGDSLVSWKCIGITGNYIVEMFLLKMQYFLILLSILEKKYYWIIWCFISVVYVWQQLSMTLYVEPI